MKRVKYIFLILIIFFFCFHFILPGFYYLIQGYQSTYQFLRFDSSAMIKGALLNFCSLTLGGLLIYFTKSDFSIKETNYKSRLYLLLSILFTIGSEWTIGKYTNALKTLLGPTGFFVFFGMFFSLDFYFIFALAASKEFLPESQFFLTLRGFISASRSTGLSIALFFLYSSWSKNAFLFVKKYFIYFLIPLSLSFFSFHWADSIRNAPPESIVSTNSENSHAQVVSSFRISEGLINNVIGRISYLELAMLPVIYKDNKINIDIFFEKYSLLNQAKLIINNISPGNLFEFDVYPCQYYRAAFIGVPIKFVQEHYTSLNMTLPVYFYMYFNSYVAVLLTGICIWIYYLMASLAFKYHPLCGSVFIYTFYSCFLTYFDWVMIIKTLVVGIIAVFLFIMTSRIQEKILSFAYKKKRLYG